MILAIATRAFRESYTSRLAFCVLCTLLLASQSEPKYLQIAQFPIETKLPSFSSQSEPSVIGTCSIDAKTPNDRSAVGDIPVETLKGVRFAKCGNSNSNIVVILLHTDWTPGWPFWVPLLHGWDPEDFEVIALDLPGDESTPIGKLTHFSFHGIADWLHEAIAHIVLPGREVVFMGHSTGGSLAEAYLRKYGRGNERLIFINHPMDKVWCQSFYPHPYIFWEHPYERDETGGVVRGGLELYERAQKGFLWPGSWDTMPTLECYVRKLPLYLFHENGFYEELWIRYLHDHCKEFRTPSVSHLLWLTVQHRSGSFLEHMFPEFWEDTVQECAKMENCTISSVSVSKREASYFWGHYPWFLNGSAAIQHVVEKWVVDTTRGA